MGFRRFVPAELGSEERSDGFDGVQAMAFREGGARTAQEPVVKVERHLVSVGAYHFGPGVGVMRAEGRSERSIGGDELGEREGVRSVMAKPVLGRREVGGSALGEDTGRALESRAFFPVLLGAPLEVASG